MKKNIIYPTTIINTNKNKLYNFFIKPFIFNKKKHYLKGIKNQEQEQEQIKNQNQNTDGLSTDSKNNEIMTYVRCLFHDFKGPLNNITMGIEIIEKTVDENNKNFEIVSNIKHSCSFLNNSLNSFLNISNIVNDDTEHFLNINIEPFNIINLIKVTQDLLYFKINEKKLGINYEIDKSVIEWVEGDFSNLQHVFLNLFSNAVKFANDNSKITIKLYSVFYRNIQTFTIDIIDENKNIIPRIKERLFEKFNTEKSSINKNGTGLGLFLCKKIINTYNGSIKHSYNLPNGNIFTIVIPLKICINQNHQSITLKNIKNNLFENKSPNNSFNSERNISNSSEKKIIKKIFIVDDDIITRKFINNFIDKIKQTTKLKSFIYEANDGLELIQSIYENVNDIDIIFIDNNMKKLNGVITTNLLRQMGYKNKIIGITGDENNNTFLKNGADFVLFKPLTMELIKQFF